jgi:hypothetical protein
MPKLTADQAAAKWGRNAQAAVGDYTEGVNRVTESPTEKAAAAEVKMLQNIMESINNGTWAASLRNITLEQWKTATATKGAQRYGPGVQAAIDKQAAYYRAAFPKIQALQDQIRGMPNLTIEDSIARAAAFMRGMHAIKGQLRG